jgi:hypothetical protein
MKSIIKRYSLIAATSLIMLSCYDDELPISDLNDRNIVYLAVSNPQEISETAVQVSTADGLASSVPNSGFIEILRTGNISQELTVSFEVTATYLSTTDFQNAGDDASSTIDVVQEGSVTFPAGLSSAAVRVNVLDDVLSAGDKEMVITLTDAPGFELGIGDNDQFAASQTITIVDDDCPIDIAGNLAGAYTLTEEFTAGTNDGFSFGFLTIVNLQADPTSEAGTRALLNQDATSPAGEDFFVDNTPLTFNTCPKTLSFASSPLALDFTVNGSTATFTLLSSSYDEAGGVLTLVGNLGNAGGSNFGEYTIILTKQ